MFLQARLDAFTHAVRSQMTLPLRVELWNGKQIDFSDAQPRVTVRVPHASALRCLLTPSLDNLGSAYVEGLIEVKGKPADMIDVVTRLAAARVGRRGRFARIRRHFSHNRVSDAAAVRYHYDVSNEFYAKWLDPNMVYSCAYFEHGDEDLAQAQTKKIDHILTKLALRPGMRLLDIGCGWGALVLRAAERYQARCVGITLSENQAMLARARAARAGLGHLIEIRVQDYREVDGQFDRITSVGMFEHVGVRHLPAYFARMHALLAPDGLAMNHGLTSTDHGNGESPLGGGAFIERYVFPQGELAHLGTVISAMQQGGLETLDVENLRRHYARTVALWSANFEAQAGAIAHLTDARRFRIWQVYLAGCQHAFHNDWISLYQIVCGRAGRDPSALAWSRRHMYPANERASVGGHV